MQKYPLFFWAPFIGAAFLIASCGGVVTALPNSAIAKNNVKLQPDESVRVSFLGKLDESSLEGNIRALQDGIVMEIEVELADGGYTLIISPKDFWVEGKALIIEIVGGEDGVHFLRGVALEDITLSYFVAGKK